MNKKVLLISYYWPPAGGVSVLRTLKVVKYLRDFGWEPVVYTAKDADYPYLDQNNFKDIPEGVTVIKRPIFEPFGLFKFLSRRKKSDALESIVQVRNERTGFIDKLGLWIRGNFFIPDARALWIGPSYRFLKKYLKKNPVDAIFSDGPPHTNTMIALKLSKNLNLPWLSDFQDPWTQADYYSLFPITRIAHRKHASKEQEVFKTANKITIASPQWKLDLERIGASDVDVLYYGFDEEDFKHIKPQKSTDKFVICHTGLLGFDRNPEMVFMALRKLIDSYTDLKNKIVLKFAGKVDFQVKQCIKKYHLEENYEDLGFIPRLEALQLISDGNLLLLPINKAKNASGRLPGKLYEYLRAGTPVLALGPKDSDASKILNDTGSGISYEYSNADALYNLFENMIIKQQFDFFHPDLNQIDSFSNYNQTKFVAELLDKIASK